MKKAVACRQRLFWHVSVLVRDSFVDDNVCEQPDDNQQHGGTQDGIVVDIACEETRNQDDCPDYD